MFGNFLMAIQFLAEVRGVSPLMAGVWTLPWTVMPLIVSPFSGRLGQRVGPGAPGGGGHGLARASARSSWR